MDPVREAAPGPGHAVRFLEEGNLALARAIQDCPPDSAGEFRRYAASCVRRALARLRCLVC